MAERDGMDHLKEWLDAVGELVEAVRSRGHFERCPCGTCAALTHYDEVNKTYG